MKPTIVYQFKIEVWRKRKGTYRYFYYTTCLQSSFEDVKKFIDSLHFNMPGKEFKTYISRVAVAMY